MDSLFFPPVVLIINVFFLFVVSRITVDEIFHILYSVIKNKSIVYACVSFIFFPGTVIHELAHFFTATILLVKVVDFKIFPEWEGNHIKLGLVVMEKTDFLRGVLVGVAPILAGFGFFWSLSAFRLFPNNNLLLNIIIVYLIFCVSTTMFSSRQDLVELIYIFPLLLLVAIIFYLFNIKIDFNLFFNKRTISFIKDINVYLFYSLIINIATLFVLKSLKYFKKR